MREETRLDAAEDDRAIGIELAARRREAAGEFLRAIDVQPEELPVRGALQRHELEIRVRRDRGAHEAHLVARLAFDVEDLLARVPDAHERLLRVVLRDLLAALERNAER